MYLCSTSLLQAVHHGPPFPPVVLVLPLVHLVDELQKGALVYGRVTVHRPAEELELLHQAVPVLRLGGDRGRQGGDRGRQGG